MDSHPEHGDREEADGDASGAFKCPSSKKLSWRIPASSIQGHKILRFDDEALASILNDPSIQLDSMVLDVVLTAKKTRTDQAIPIDLNGIQAFDSGGASAYHSHDQDGADSCTYNLGHMKLNGAETFPAAMHRIASKKGDFVLSLHGEDIRVAEAELVLQGSTLGSCPTPTASPTPIASGTPIATPIPAPHTTIVSVSPSGNVVSSTSMSIEFTGDQSGLSFQCAIDGGLSALCTSPVLYSNLSNGAHTFHVVAINASGVADPAGASYSWSIDSVAPSVTITNAAQLPTLTRSTEITFEFTADEPSTFQCSLDGGAFADCASPLQDSGLTEGLHDFQVKAVDPYGNSGSPARFQWRVDLTPPAARFVSVSPADSHSSATSGAFEFTADESATFECALDAAAFAVCTSPVAANSLADGVHQFTIRATDTAGNVGAASTYSWSVDTVPPRLSLVRAVPQEGMTSATAVSAEFAADEASVYSCKFDDAAWADCTSPFTASISTEGLHQLRVVARDLAGNPSSELQVSWITDFTLPQIAWGAMMPSAASRINATTFTADVTSSEPVTLSCALNGMAFNPTSTTVQLNGLLEGPYSIAARGTDGAGNVSNTLTHDFTVDLTAPSITLSSQAPVLTGANSNTFTFSADEEASFECSLDHAGFSLCSSPFVVSGLAEGQHLFELRGTDVAGNTSGVSSYAWTVDSTSPVVTAFTIVVGRTNVTVNWTTSEPTTGKVQWGLGTATGNSTAEDTTLSTSHSIVVSPLAPNTIYSVMAVGHDQAGNAYQSTKRQFRTNP